jgi:hypothetical protein
MTTSDDLISAKSFLRNQLLQLGIGGSVVSRRPTISISSAVASAGRNVHAVGIGKKISTGNQTDEKCVRIYVVQKLPLSVLSPRDVIPETIDGVLTDVIEANPAFAFTAQKKTTPKTVTTSAVTTSAVNCSQQRRQRKRPIIGGISSGHRDITAGTLGCFCHSTNILDDTGAVFALSNNHVYANVNAALIGDPLYQPGAADGGGLNDYFAKLHRFVPIKLGGSQANRVDAALGSILPSVNHTTEICQIGNIAGTLSAQEDMEIRKHGRTTGYTEGYIDDISYDALVSMDHNDPNVIALFENQLRVVSRNSQPIGLGGDSGSVIVHRTQNKIVGLYFAGPDNGSYGIANRIEDVMNELEVTIP